MAASVRAPTQLRLRSDPDEHLVPARVLWQPNGIVKAPAGLARDYILKLLFATICHGISPSLLSSREPLLLPSDGSY